MKRVCFSTCSVQLSEEQTFVFEKGCVDEGSFLKWLPIPYLVLYVGNRVPHRGFG